MNKVMITGANGFIGSRASSFIASKGWGVSKVQKKGVGDNVLNITDIGPKTDWTEALKKIDVVIHLAARVHCKEDAAADSLEAFRRTNVYGSRRLATQAAELGVRRFVFISSVKVNGESSLVGQPFTSSDTPSPEGSYAVSKYEAEQALRQVAEDTGMEVVIIRPPLVYGPGVKANLLKMMTWIYRGLPLPFGAINNNRSLVALDNLVELVEKCISHPAAANRTFMVSDGEDLSTTELLRYLASGMEREVLLFPVPPPLLVGGLKMIGKQNVAQRLCGNLQVNINKTRELLGWMPSVSTKDALRKTAQFFMEVNKKKGIL